MIGLLFQLALMWVLAQVCFPCLTAGLTLGLKQQFGRDFITLLIVRIILNWVSVCSVATGFVSRLQYSLHRKSMPYSLTQKSSHFYKANLETDISVWKPGCGSVCETPFLEGDMNGSHLPFAHRVHNTNWLLEEEMASGKSFLVLSTLLKGELTSSLDS